MGANSESTVQGLMQVFMLHVIHRVLGTYAFFIITKADYISISTDSINPTYLSDPLLPSPPPPPSPGTGETTIPSADCRWVIGNCRVPLSEQPPSKPETQ